MPRHIKLGLVAFGLVLVVGISYFYNLQRHINQLVHPAPEPPQPYLVERPAYSEAAPLKKINLFFPSKAKDGLLEAETRNIYSSDQVAIEARQIVAELIAGSKEGRDAALPVETKLREVFVTDQGLAVVDLTKEASSNHPGGLTQEITSIYAVVNSLTENLSTIAGVQILIEGVEAETLAGHVDLTHPFSRDLSLRSTVTNSEKDDSGVNRDELRQH
jgi:spore germination protein GerM